MASLFDLAANDQSIYYLGQIFGSIGTVLTPGGSKTVFNIVGTMFKTINGTALVLGALLITYTTVVGLLKTAHEGQFLGKEWNKLWVPLRMVMGIASLFPTGSGYSVIQIIMMWFIIQGIGAADTLWTTILKYVSVMGSPYASVSIPTSIGINEDMKSLFKALVCADAAKRAYPDTYVKGEGQNQNYYYCAANPSDPFCGSGFPKLSQMLTSPGSYRDYCIRQTDDKKTPLVKCAIGPVRGDSGACGSIIMGDVDRLQASSSVSGSITRAAFTAQKTILTTSGSIIPYLEDLAKIVNDADYGYRKFYENTSVKPPAPDPFIQQYCLKMNRDLAQCCVYEPIAKIDCTVPPPSILNPNPALPAGCQSTCATRSSNIFPRANASMSGGIDNTNNSREAAQSIIWPCRLQPFISQSGEVCATGALPSDDFITKKVKDYTGYVNAAVAAAMQAAVSSQPVTPEYEQAQRTGWLLAGAFYYRLASSNKKNQEAAMPPFSVLSTDPFSNDTNPTLRPYRNNYKTAEDILNKIASQTNTSPDRLANNSTFQSVSSLAAGGILDIFMHAMSGTTSGEATNPLVAMQQTGFVLIVFAQVLFFTYLAIALVVLVVGKINILALGTGLTDSPVSNMTQFLFNSLYIVVIAFCGWCITVGGLLSVYTPLIPYTIFTFGVIGWFTQVIEAMVAGPFVALGILAPGGKHDLLGHADASIMLMLDIFLRPLLMVTGMIFAMLLSTVVVSMINAGFRQVMGDISGAAPGSAGVGGVPGLPEQIMFCTAYTALVIAALNKCFALIHILPENVLQWIGGRGRAAGEADAVSAMKGAVEAGGALAMSGAKETLGAGKEGGAASNKDMQAKKDKGSQANVAATKPPNQPS